MGGSTLGLELKVANALLRAYSRAFIHNERYKLVGYLMYVLQVIKCCAYTKRVYYFQNYGLLDNVDPVINDPDISSWCKYQEEVEWVDRTCVTYPEYL